MTEEVSDRFGVIDAEGYQYGERVGRVYLLTELEMDLLAWAPVWTRRRIIKRVKAETKFEEASNDRT